MTDNIILDENGVENMEGHKGKPINTGYGHTIGDPVGRLNVKDLDAIAAQIVAAKGTPNWDILLQKYDGPGTGVDFNSDVAEYRILDGWHVDDNGDIVPD